MNWKRLLIALGYTLLCCVPTAIVFLMALMAEKLGALPVALAFLGGCVLLFYRLESLK